MRARNEKKFEHWTELANVAEGIGIKWQDAMVGKLDMSKRWMRLSGRCGFGKKFSTTKMRSSKYT
jgi:hypothetical protein